MLAYIGQRLLSALPALFGVSLIVFAMLRLLPGDPARTIAGPYATADEIERIRAQLELDQPIAAQYARFLGRLVRLDLGTSARSSQPVFDEVLARLPNTMRLAVASIVIATVIGAIAGVLAATNHNRFPDYALSALMLFGVSMPAYWLGLMLIVVFAINLQWLPAAGSQDPGAWILPTVTLASYSVALITRMTRSTMLEVLHADYVRTARAKGLAQPAVVYGHALRNALLPVVTVVGLQFGTLLGGAVLTETVFGWPGVGQLLIDSLSARDYPLVQGAVLIFSALFILVNLAVDVCYAYIDPRVRYR
jgi:peptide/nickel transport system permease protein/oligopeptide transport system permease protein